MTFTIVQLDLGNIADYLLTDLRQVDCTDFTKLKPNCTYYSDFDIYDERI